MQPGEDPRVFGTEAREDAGREFHQHVLARRRAAGVHNDPAGPWGLALSGGGIRSATFCLGLVRGLARSGLLKHFDYLSTVSGGGYLGASLGRHYSDASKAHAVETGVASDDSMWLWWLRNNGRYLTPAGAKDLGYATASIVRGVISTHLEIGILILAMAVLVLLPHFLVALFPPFHAGSIWNHAVASTMPSTWGWLMLLPLFYCVHQVCAYWYTRDPHSATSVVLVSGVVAGCIALAITAGREAFDALEVAGRDPPPQEAGRYVAARLILAWLVLAPATAAVAHLRDLLRGTPASVQRLRRTKRFSYGLWALAIGFALLLLDWSTWQLTRLFWSGEAGQVSRRLAGTILVVATVGRLVLPEVQRSMATSKGPRLNLERVLNVTGLALSVLVAVLWTALLSVLLFPEATRLQYWDPIADPQAAWRDSRLQVLVAVGLGCLAYIVATLKSYDLLNLASLHNYYRARIERAYVSSGNCGPEGGRFAGCALDPVSPERTAGIAPLTEAIPGDDVDLGDYRPHEHGGPIHLINCCINQSVDDRTGLYNADRKGVAVAVSALGVELGTSFPDGDTGAARRARLSQWIAISGAAASTGMGSRTSTGLAALLFMSGIRLGYWMPALVRRETKGAIGRLLAAAPKPVAIVAESLARFPGLSSPVWYVSDGGHFDNTGVHALLKRRAPVIVAADCGADPMYLFSDLESLVRKAKIDYRARIEFIRSGTGGLPEPLDRILGTPETIQPGLGTQWLLLGRISYDDGSTGVLLVVKPRRLDAMPFDMVAYADRAPDFPQQTTGDQFFDEAQWESYHQLGLLMGAAITPALVADAVAIAGSDEPADSSLEDAEKQSAAAALALAKQQRSKRAGVAVRATLGAGISLSLLVAAWQGFEQYREAGRNAQRLYEAEVLELSRKIERYPAEPLLQDDFEAIARASAARGDGRYQRVLDRLGARCEVLADSDRRCLDLYGTVQSLVAQRPEPFYDYWFEDKRAAFVASRLSAPTDRADAPAQEAGTAVVAMTGAPDAPLVAAAAEADPDLQAHRDRQAALERQLQQQRAMAAQNEASAADDRITDITIAPPPPAAAAEPMPGLGDVPAVAPAPPTGRCAPNVKLFVHVYDADSVAAAQALGARLQQALGADSAPIQDVVATAARLGRAAPYAWSTTAVVYPERSSQECIDRIRGVVGDDARIRTIGYGTPDAFELWIPPRTAAPTATRP